jgi:hypothetical protein
MIEKKKRSAKLKLERERERERERENSKEPSAHMKQIVRRIIRTQRHQRSSGDENYVQSAPKSDEKDDAMMLSIRQ